MDFEDIMAATVIASIALSCLLFCIFVLVSVVIALSWVVSSFGLVPVLVVAAALAVAAWVKARGRKQ